MTINLPDINELFSKPSLDNKLYQAGLADIIFRKAQTSKSVQENKLYDFIQSENDPNFNRNNIHTKEKYETFISNVSMTTKTLTTINSYIQMAEIKAFMPENLKALLFNFQTITDTGINYLNNIQQLTTFNNIETVFLKDLELNFYGNVVSFSDIITFYNRIKSLQMTLERQTNDSIRPLLALELQNILPNSLTGVLDSLNYIDKIDTIFENNTNNKNEFNAVVKNDIEDYEKRKVKTIVNETAYNNPVIDLNDPIGFVTKDAFLSEITQVYKVKIETIVEERAKIYNLETTEITDIINLFHEDIDRKVQELKEIVFALPPITKIVNGVKIDTYNKTKDAIQNAVKRFANDRILEIENINLPDVNTDPIDYLINIKRDIKRRRELEKIGATSGEFAAIDSLLKSYLKTDIINSNTVKEIDERLKFILREDIEVRG